MSAYASADEISQPFSAPYPNPSNGVMNFSSNQDLDQNLTIRIFSLDGKIMYEEIMSESNMTIQQSEIGVGTFIYQFISNEAVLKTGKISFVH